MFITKLKIENTFRDHSTVTSTDSEGGSWKKKKKKNSEKNNRQ